LGKSKGVGQKGESLSLHKTTKHMQTYQSDLSDSQWEIVEKLLDCQESANMI
jgi:hypothetical protein